MTSDKKLKILVIDDEILVVKFISAALLNAPYEITFANNGAEAMKCLQQGSFDLILTDLKMPNMDGMQFYANLLQTIPAMTGKIIVMTGDTIGRETRGFLEESRLPFITKPFNATVLRQTVAQALAGTSRTP